MLLLFPLFGASYCTGYLFILLIFTIVQLNVLLLLCNNIYSCLPNRRVVRNKRGGGKDEPFFFSVVPGISMVVRILWSVTLIKRRTKFSILFRILLSASAKASCDFCMYGNRMLSTFLPRACQFS